MNKTWNLVGIFQLFLLKSRFNNNSLKILLKCIEPCVDCECPTCDINIKKDAVVDKDKSDYYMCISEKYTDYIKKFDHHKFYEQCDCPNCFTFKCPIYFFEDEYFIKMEQDIKNFINLVNISGIYIFTLVDCGSSHACYEHCFLMNDGKYRIYRDREFDCYQFFENETVVINYIDQDNFFRLKRDDIKKSNRNTRKLFSKFSFIEYSSIEKFLNDCQGMLTFLNRYCIDFNNVIEHILKF